MSNRKPRALVVDDEEPIRVLLARVLARAGFEIAEASDGQDAIERLDAGDFDAVLLDLMMPRVDGFGVVDHLIETNPHMIEKTIVLTAFPKTATEGRLHHLCSVLTKPFDVEQLVVLARECAAK
jgi:CheY-like chemotaxis protein